QFKRRGTNFEFSDLLQVIDGAVRRAGENSGVVFDLTERVPNLLDRAHAVNPINRAQAADVNARFYNSETLANSAQVRGHKRGLYRQTLHTSQLEKPLEQWSLSL